MNLFILDTNYNKIGVLSNQGVNPQAPYFDDLFTQELDTSADTYYFSTLATYYAQDIIKIGHHVVFEFNNKQKMFVISSLEYEHKDGMNVIGVYAEGAGFELLETYKKDIKIEQCSYSKFLATVLEGTNWKYQVSSSLANNLQDVDYTQEKNVYAMLQDSMQTFQGVELEFLTDYRNGAPTKTIRAYANGERGSFVGERFEYGVNVKGITKTENVSNIKDEDIIFYEGLVNINGLQVEITYDVDFALKSAQIPDYNIGDTHYIIDNDFNPPMQIKGRIGKIEISFSDPTRNKMYLANFKKITGSRSENTNEDDIKDIIDDVIDDIEDIGEHDHQRLVDGDYMVYYTGGIQEDSDGLKTSYINFDTYDELGVSFQINNRAGDYDWATCYLQRNTPEATNSSYMNDALIFTSANHLIPNVDGEQLIGNINNWWFFSYINNMHSARSFSSCYYMNFDRGDLYNGATEINDSSDVTKQDLLDFILDEINIYSFVHEDALNEDVKMGLPASDVGDYLGILSDDFIDHNSGNSCGTTKVGALIAKNALDEDSDEGHNSHVYNLPSLVCALIGAFQQHVNGGGGSSEEGGGEGDAVFDNLHVRKWLTLGSDTTPAGFATGIKLTDNTYGTTITPGSLDARNITANNIDATTIDVDEDLDAQRIRVYDGGLHIFSSITFSDGSVLSSAKGLGGGGNDGDDGNDGGSGNPDLSDYATKEYVEEYVGIEVDKAENYAENCVNNSHNTLNGIIMDKTNALDERIKKLESENDGSNPGGGGDAVFDTITVNKIIAGDYDPNVEQTGMVEFAIGLKAAYISCIDSYSSLTIVDHTIHRHDISMYGDIHFDFDCGIEFVDGSRITSGGSETASDRSLKENIRYIDDAVMTTSDDLLEKADLYDFIVNQVNLCEFNYIGDDSDKIGFIANDYEGTKVGDKIVSRNSKTDTLVYNVNNLLFSTIGALQEEVRIRDEEITTLEDRLAKIEEMLGINNN